MSDLVHFLAEEGIAFKAVTNWAVKAQRGGLRFEVELAKLDELESVYVLRFKRIGGDLADYKTLCSHLLAGINL